MMAWKIAPALAAGCTIVLKPSELTPVTALVICELAKEAGIPAGVLNVVPGLGATTGEAIARHPDIDKVSRRGANEHVISADKPGRIHWFGGDRAKDLGGGGRVQLEEGDARARWKVADAGLRFGRPRGSSHLDRARHLVQLGAGLLCDESGQSLWRNDARSVLTF